MLYLFSSNSKTNEVKNSSNSGILITIVSAIVTFGSTMLDASLKEKAEKRQLLKEQEIHIIRSKEKEEKARL